MTTILELQQKSAELRHAALRFQTSANTLRSITAHVSQIGDDLALLGYESPAATQWMAHYRSEHQWMNGWADTMIHFAQSLTQAADQIDATIAQMEHPAPAHAHTTAAVVTTAPPTAPAVTPPPLASGHVLHPTLAQMKPLDTFEGIYSKIKNAAFTRMRDVTPNVDQYLSVYNHSRMDTYMIEQQTLAAKQVGLGNLMAQRSSAEQTLHMLMEHAATDPRPELARLTQNTQAHLQQLDAQIKSARADVDSLQNDVTTLGQRLELLRPSPDASLRLIHSMETGTSPQWLVDSTFDCVRYIVSKVHVPPGLAHDAYLWNDQTNVLQEYGINVGHVPMPGAVLVMERTHPYADPVHGHLMYVEKVDNNGDVWITDNLHPHPVKLSDLTDQTSGPNMEYLYFPWQTHA
ncbi:MAG TPA: CHAP domain-containing protein [Phototrophicaceae bacterium]|nr:CHAP domain-containing protein [Phototrophicaceae bacterium]